MKTKKLLRGGYTPVGLLTIDLGVLDQKYRHNKRKKKDKNQVTILVGYK